MGKRHIVLVALIATLFVTLIVQFAYPRNRVLPFARLDDVRVGGKSDTQLTQVLIDEYSNLPLSVTIEGPVKQQTSKVKTVDAGLQPDAVKIIQGLKSYPWWQRLVPGSLLIKGALKNQPIVTRLDTQRFNEFARTQLELCKVAPKNAAVMAKNGEIVLDPAKNGQQCVAADLKKEVLATKLEKTQTSVMLEAKTIKPIRSDKHVKDLLSDAKKLAERKVSLKLLDTEYSVAKATLASWFIFTEDTKDKTKVALDVDTKPIRDYLAEMQKKIYIAPGTTTVITLDGVETGRTEGVAGRGINFTTTADALKKQVLKEDGVVLGDLVSVPARVVFQRSYSPTQNGLQALLNDLVKDKGNYGIAVRFTDGSVVSASGSKRYHPASTYKMFVAFSLLKRIAANQMKWEDEATAGKNVSQCFDVMIVNSDNTCAEWLGDKIGWQNVTNDVRGLGLASTNVIRGAMYSTAEDQTLFLHKINTGALADAEKNRLLDVMKRQAYRSGIPAGTGLPVADKVGFLNGDLHDSGLVFGSKTYALSIMTSGSSWSQIADAARQINAQINRM